MKLKLILTTAIVGGVLALPSVSSAAPAPTQDSVAQTAGPGVVETTVTDPNTGQTFRVTILIFDLNATSGPSGENPSGLVSFDFGPLAVSGPVTCLAVSGNSATINFQQQLDFDAGAILTVQVLDNQPDTFNFSLTNREPTDCSPLPIPGLPLVSGGSITVVDAQPVPTTKDQCKGGGWKQFGFKNEGLCIAFVNHGS